MLIKSEQRACVNLHMVKYFNIEATGISMQRYSIKAYFDDDRYVALAHRNDRESAEMVLAYIEKCYSKRERICDLGNMYGDYN